MLQGTGSDVGKTVLVAGLCRLARRKGLRVKPFKPQNMSNNAAVADQPLLDGEAGGEIGGEIGGEMGGEIGRAQWLQALACGVAPTTDMNPVLLKPQSETGSQIVVHGKVWGAAKGRDYQKLKPQLMDAVMTSFNRLGEDCDLVIVEGAGSAAEINLRAGDIANMGFATEANVPVVLVADIDRGGVIASLVGTYTILPAADRDMVCGYLINKFRGDASLFEEGLAQITGFTGWTGLGVVPYIYETMKLPAEDSVALEKSAPASGDGVVVAVPTLSRIANFDDLDPIKQTPGVRLVFVRPGEAWPQDARLVVLPGSKSTIADLNQFKDLGWDVELLNHVARGGHVLGICGGYQMLGHVVRDPDAIEGTQTEARGLGLLDVETVLIPQKTVMNRSAVDAESGESLSGYEIHMGRTSGPGTDRPMIRLDGRDEGAISDDGRVRGSYLHGLFTSDGWRNAFLSGIGIENSAMNYRENVEAALDALADQLERVIDPAIWDIPA
ncbi:MAG: cobyric acid synthase [Rhizobiaceae bacterium]|nr:cobyric acid synthase [Rhizobiaceae bacterium]